MISYTKKNVITITLIITVLIFSVISVIISKFSWKNETTNDEQFETVQGTKELVEENILENTEENTKNPDSNWSIYIPQIGVVADIKEGTTQDVIAQNVGHFITTSTINGNVCIAAHNRGYGEKSYFKNIKNLNNGDEIIYQKDGQTKKYEVVNNLIIAETDWSYLQNTEDNRITLITCVENMPEYRCCVQAIEV